MSRNVPASGVKVRLCCGTNSTGYPPATNIVMLIAPSKAKQSSQYHSRVLNLRYRRQKVVRTATAWRLAEMPNQVELGEIVDPRGMSTQHTLQTVEVKGHSPEADNRR